MKVKHSFSKDGRLAAGKARSKPEARLDVRCQEAFRKTLPGLPIYKRSSGRFTVPVLEANESGLPFSMALDLYSATSETLSSDMAARPREGLFSLQYILDGTGKLVKSQGESEDVQSGDSILAMHGHTFIQASDGKDGVDDPDSDSADEWHMASITLLLPKDTGASSPGEDGAKGQGAQLGLSGESIRCVTEAEAARIVAGARDGAQEATRRQNELHTAASPPSTSKQADEPREAAERVLERRNDPLAASVHARTADATATSPQDRAEESGSSGGGGGISNARRYTGFITGRSQAAETSRSDNAAVDTAGGGEVSKATAAFLGRDETHEIGSGDRQGALDAIRNFLRKLALWRQSAAEGQPDVLKRSLAELSAFRLPHQTNRLALVFDPLGDQVNFTFGVEIFEPGHKTTPHVHQQAHELFFILAGEGEGFCDDQRFPVAAGDVVVFPPGSTHGIDVAEANKMYCLEIMQPNDMFAELVRAGMPAGSLLDDDLCILIASGCS